MSKVHLRRISVWFRYIDDIFFVWDHGEEKLNEWLSYLNNQHHSIKFTSEWSRSEINFLDTTVKVDENMELYTDLYIKPTDTNGYLMYDSAHAPHVKRGLPYSQFLRLRRICKLESDFEKHLKQKESLFRDRGYT